MEKKYINRPIYTERIRPFIGKQLIKVLTGQRRTGKSYILLQIIDVIRDLNPEAHIIYIDKELVAFSTLTDSESLYSYVMTHLSDGKENYLFIDEVQEIKEFQIAIRSLLNENRCDIYCTGSNAKILSGELSTHLSGRYIEIHIHSLSYREFLDFNQLMPSEQSLNQYLTFGGMPYIHHLSLNDKEVVYEYLRNVYSSILLKDVVARESIRNVAFLESLVSYLIDNTGSLFSSQNISKFLKSQHINIPTQTILNYLRALCNSFFIYKVQRAEVNGLKIFEIGEKYYFEDLGIRNAIRPSAYRMDIGKWMENVIYIDLLRHGYKVYVGKNETKEIDFIAEKGSTKLFIQVAYLLYDENTVQREFGGLMEIANHYPKYVITMDRMSNGENYQGIKQLYLGDFLLAEDKERL
ncbi:MAG: ATP-binding protein [Bacteroides sp.]|nr:ATP-binding protein [Bacteroides sp.]